MTEYPPLALTSGQCLRARHLLGWSRYRLIALTGMQEGCSPLKGHGYTVADQQLGIVADASA